MLTNVVTRCLVTEEEKKRHAFADSSARAGKTKSAPQASPSPTLK